MSVWVCACVCESVVCVHVSGVWCVCVHANLTVFHLALYNDCILLQICFKHFIDKMSAESIQLSLKLLILVILINLLNIEYFFLKHKTTHILSCFREKHRMLQCNGFKFRSNIRIHSFIVIFINLVTITFKVVEYNQYEFIQHLKKVLITLNNFSNNSWMPLAEVFLPKWTLPHSPLPAYTAGLRVPWAHHRLHTLSLGSNKSVLSWIVSWSVCPCDWLHKSVDRVLN